MGSLCFMAFLFFFEQVHWGHASSHQTHSVGIDLLLGFYQPLIYREGALLFDVSPLVSIGVAVLQNYLLCI